MKLFVRWLKGAYGGVPALFDESGALLPCQTECKVSARVGQLSEVTVTFVVDDASVVIEPQEVVGNHGER